MSLERGEFGVLKSLVPKSPRGSLRTALTDIADRSTIPPPTGDTIGIDYLETLLDTLEHEDEDERRNAAFALQQIGLRYPDFLSGTEQQLFDIAIETDNAAIQGYMIDMLSSMGEEELLSSLADRFKQDLVRCNTDADADAEVVSLAAAGCDQVSWERPALVAPVADQLLALTDHKEKSIRRTAVTALLCLAAWQPDLVGEALPELAAQVVTAGDPSVIAGMKEAEMMVPLILQRPNVIVPVMHQTIQQRIDYSSQKAAEALMIAASIQGQRLAATLP